jgi:predicted DCC family thiol-disulfide oxidoreductase YuxK
MSAVYPLTLLYDGRCGVCSLEMDHLRERNAAGRLVFVDINESGFDPVRWGATHAEVDALIHGVAADGRVLRGVEVLRLAYAAVGLGWVLRPTGWGPLRPLADAGYRVFARHRRTISRVAAPLIDAVRAARARRCLDAMAACASGACDTSRRPS